VILLGGYKTRHEESNYRSYEFAGASHIRNIDVAEFNLPDPDKANPAEWSPFIRALFVAANNWCDGIEPPPSVWLGAPDDAEIVRDAKGNALVQYVGGQPVDTDAFRLPEVAVGENRYFAYDSSYDDGTFLGFFRVLGGGFIDLTDSFTDHEDYVKSVAYHALGLQSFGFLLEADADAIIRRASQSDIGK
jgi:hypothetical protein